ncbi:Hrp1p [Nakaseomyces bracarensis]|uniref:Hrp1p n=1 Tax=Nakaseomyces bracarensis TaxID=273131 RepID=UPI0038719175
MSSDEDFDDIYGDVKEEKASGASEVSGEASGANEVSGEANEVSGDKSGANGPAEGSGEQKVPPEATSALDQLAALQAGASSSAMPWETLQNTLNQLQTKGEDESSTATDANTDANANATTSTSTTTTNAYTNTNANTSSNVESGERSVRADLSKDSCKMFIGGLNWETTEDGLRDYFSKYGAVEELKIMKDPATGRSRGFGFLTFESARSVDEVVKTQHILDGKVIDPKRAIPREEQDKTGKIFVGGIGPDVRPKEFEEFFAQWGTIIDAQLMLDKDTGRSRGFGFITYDSPDAVDKVCQNKFIDFKGKKIEIKRAAPRHLQKTGGNRQPNQQQQQNSGNYMGGAGSSNNSNNQYAAGYNQGYQDPSMMAGGYNPMMAGFNPMFANNNPQMAEYFQKMQDYYKQMQQQGGMDYNQMYQQQMQQMAMMMPGFNPAQMKPQQIEGSPNSASNQGSETSTPNPDEDRRDSRRSGPPGGHRGRQNDNRRGYHPYSR